MQQDTRTVKKAFKRCAVHCCNNTSRNSQKLFITFPLQSTARRKWREAAKNENIHNSKHIVVCEDHFDVSTFFTCIA